MKKQLTGTAIGTTFAPPYAIISMADLEERILKDIEPKRRIWWRYIDDIFLIWDHGEDLLKQFIETLHACHPIHQFLDSTSCHPYHCKKSIPYSQALRYNRICSDNKKFDQRCNNLEKWLMERGYSERMVRTQILKARGESRDSLLEQHIHGKNLKNPEW